MQRQRDPQLIRTDAIKMGIKKAHQGCIECAAKYFELAKQYGARQTEFHQAVDRLSFQPEESKFGRRDLLKLVAAVSTVYRSYGIRDTAERRWLFLQCQRSRPSWPLSHLWILGPCRAKQQAWQSVCI